MEKIDTAWIFVRALGVYFAAEVFIYLYSLSALFFSLSKVYEIAKFNEEAEIEIIRSWIDISIIGVQFFVFCFLAYYCLRKGAFIHKLLMFGGKNEKT